MGRGVMCHYHTYVWWNVADSWPHRTKKSLPLGSSYVTIFCNEST